MDIRENYPDSLAGVYVKQSAKRSRQSAFSDYHGIFKPVFLQIFDNVTLYRDIWTTRTNSIAST